MGALAVVGVWWSVRPDRDRADLLKAARGGDFAAAEPRLRQLLERRPDDAEVAEVLARGYVAVGNNEEAEAAMTRWVELGPPGTGARKFRFEFHRQAKNHEKALADGRKLLDADPTDLALRRTVTGLAFSIGEFDEAEANCRVCLKEQPTDQSLRLLLAEILRAKGQPAAAADTLDRLLADRPGLPAALLARAILYEENGDAEQAIPLLRDVMQKDPTRQRTAGYQLSLALGRVGRNEESKQVLAEVRRRQDVEVFTEAIKTQPDNLDLRVRLATLLLADGHTRDGLSLLESVLARDPNYPAAHRALADHYEKSGDTTRAADHRRRAGTP